MGTCEHLKDVIALATVLAGCGTTPLGNPQLLAFLQDGATTREDVYLQLAEPSAPRPPLTSTDVGISTALQQL